MLEQDDDVIAELRQLRALWKSGEITETMYMARFRAINAQVGKPCTRCGTVPAVEVTDQGDLCGRCALAERRGE